MTESAHGWTLALGQEIGSLLYDELVNIALKIMKGYHVKEPC